MIVCTIGRKPSIANPAATPTMVCSMMPTLTARLRVCAERAPELTGADLGQDQRDARILVQQIGGGRPRPLAHREVAHHSPSGMSATTAVGRISSRTVSAVVQARRGRARRRPASTSRTPRASRPTAPIGRLLLWLSTTRSVRLVEVQRRREQDRLPVRALVQLGVAGEDHHALLGSDLRRGARARRRPTSGSPWPSEPVDASTPGHELAVGMAAELAAPVHEVVEPRSRGRSPRCARIA